MYQYVQLNIQYFNCFNARHDDDGVEQENNPCLPDGPWVTYNPGWPTVAKLKQILLSIS